MALGLPKTPVKQITLRWWWRKYKANANKSLVTVKYFDVYMPVPLITQDAWRAFETIVRGYNYPKPSKGFWTYVNRNIAGTSTKSLHAYGIAGDKDPQENRYRHEAKWEHTLFTEILVKALLAVKTDSGKQVFAWGGQWTHRQDLMHWYITCSPKNLATGIDSSTLIALDIGEEEIMRKGDKGKAVILMQKALMAYGFTLPRFGADGDFGNETLAAVEAFQVSLGLASTGIIGGVTASLLTTKSGTRGLQGPTGPRGVTGHPGVQGVRGPTGAVADLSQYKLVKQ